MRISSLAPLLLVLAAAPAAAQRAGLYDVQGSSLAGDSYRGIAQLEPTGPHTWRIGWLIDGEAANGIGLAEEGRLTVAYQIGDELGLAIYRPQPDGSLLGRWTQGHEGNLGEERLTPR